MPKLLKRSNAPSRQLLPAAFRRPLQQDDAAIDALWERYHESRDRQAYELLVNHYLPLCTMAAARAMKRWPNVCRDFDEALSDASLSLLHAIERTDRGGRVFAGYALWRMRKDILKGMVSRSWIGKRASAAQSIIGEARALLIQELGRLPTPGELNYRLAGVFFNPNFYMRPLPNLESDSQTERGNEFRRQRDRIADNSTPSPDRPAIDRETMRLAMKGLCPIDQTILRMMLRGMQPSEIGKKVHLTGPGVAYRLNGVLWEARSRADLAEYLGVESSPIPAKTAKNGMRGKGRATGKLPHFTNQPPARMVG